jgi:hypothetical protein
VFSDQAIGEEIVGKQIEATITLTGSTEGVRWMVKEFSALP